MTAQLIEAHAAHRGSVIAITGSPRERGRPLRHRGPLHERGAAVWRSATWSRSRRSTTRHRTSPCWAATCSTPKIFDILEQTPPRGRRRDPADRCHPRPDRGPAGLRLRVRRQPSRRRHPPRLAGGQRRAGARVGHWRTSSAPTSVASTCETDAAWSMIGGRVIAGRYRLIAPLGEGGMATSGAPWTSSSSARWRSRSSAPSSAPIRDSPPASKHEARSRPGLSHPNVVQVYDFGTDGEIGDQYIVMQLVEGQDLADRPQGARLALA